MVCPLFPPGATQRAELRRHPEVAARLAEARQQLAGYRKALEDIYVDKLDLRTHAVVCSIGLARLVW